MSKKKQSKSDNEPMIRCQFCDADSPAKDWKESKTVCPKCGKRYDAELAQEEDD
jgi:hypothetical protein